MMFAHTIKLNILCNDSVCFLTETYIKFSVHCIATEYFLKHFSHTSRCLN